MSSTGHVDARDNLLWAAPVIVAAALATYSPVPEVGFVLQLTGLGTVIGMAVALYLDMRRARPVDWPRLIAGFTVCGLLLGLGLIVVDEVVSAL